MKKEVKLVNKVKHLLKRLGCPRWLHKFGPKTYELYQHLSPLLIRYFCKGLSYRRVVKLLDLLGIECPSKSALQYNSKKIPSAVWNKAIEVTSGIKHYIVAIDSTGLSRTNPSYYYLKRIDGKMPKIPIKLNAALDTRTKKFCAAKVRVLPSHDIKDAKCLVKRSKPSILVADKGYDANWLHKFCSKNKIEAHIPMRDYGKRVLHKHYSARRKAAKLFRKRTYGRREIIESGFSSFKQKYGSSVSSKSSETIKAEVYGKIICHNLFGTNFEI